MPDIEKKPELSAGVVVMRHDPLKGPCVLTLRVYGKLDLPKGHAEPEHATILQTAKDELYQESNFVLMPMGSELMASIPVAALISDDNYKCSNVDIKTGRVKKDVFLYAADTLYSGPIDIRPNKDGIREHEEAIWLPFDKVESSKLHAYMKPGVLWAMDQYKQHVLRR